MRMLRVRKKFFWTAGILAVLVFIAGFAIANINKKDASAYDEMQLTMRSGQGFWYGTDDKPLTHKFWINNNGVEMDAYCADAHIESHPKDGDLYSTKRYKIEPGDTSKEALYYKIMYYGHLNYSNESVDENIIIHYALHYAKWKDEDISSDQGRRIINRIANPNNNYWAPYALAAQLYNEANSEDTVIPAGENYLYHLNYGNNDDRQSIMGYTHEEITTWSLTATKVWNDTNLPNYAYAARPDYVTFYLYDQDNNLVAFKDLYPMNGDKASNNWGTVTFDDLDQTKAYHVDESVSSSSNFYKASSQNCDNITSTSNTTCTITNSLKNIHLIKNWANDQASERPEVYFCVVDQNNKIYSKDENYCFHVAAESANTVTHDFYGIPVEYSVCELNAANYAAASTGSYCPSTGSNNSNVIAHYLTSYEKTISIDNLSATQRITNTQKTKNFTIYKRWSDENTTDRPETIYVCLTEIVNSDGVEYEIVNRPEDCGTISSSSTTSSLAFSNLNETKNYGACEVDETTYNAIKAGEDSYICDKTANPVYRYTTTYDHHADSETIWNTHDEGVYVNITKVWDDEGHEDLRPNSITVKIYSTINGTNEKRLVDTVTVTPAEGEDKTASTTWAKSFGPYDMYVYGGEYDGVLLEYSIEEVTVNNAYGTKIVSKGNNHYEIQNTTTFLKVRKVWDDAGHSNYRPDHVTFMLECAYYPYYARYSSCGDQNGYTITAEDYKGKDSNGNDYWEKEVGPLPTYSYDTLLPNYTVPHFIEYRFREVIESSWRNEYTPSDDSGYTQAFGDTYTATNSARFINVRKLWDDDSNVDGQRPESIGIKIEALNQSNEVVKTYNETISASDGYGNVWNKEYGPYPKYYYYVVDDDPETDDRIALTYRVTEILPDGSEYTESNEGVVTLSNNSNLATFTNSYHAETELEVNKHWLIGDAPKASLPEIITINIYRNGLLDNEVGPVRMYLTDEIENAFSEDPTYNPNLEYLYQNVWRKTITGLDKYDENGNLINWTAGEQQVSGYEGDTVCASKNGKKVCDIINARSDTVSLYIYKEWKDSNGNDLDANVGKPRKVRFIIWQIGYDVHDNLNERLYYKSIFVEEDPATHNWIGTVNDLPRYDNRGRELSYEVEEVAAGPYYSNVSVSTGGDHTNGRDQDGNYYFTATNTLKDETDIIVRKCWADNNNRYNTRPTSLTFTFTTEINGTSTSEPFTLTSQNLVPGTNCWEGKKTGLLTHDADDNEYHYSFEENVDGLGNNYIAVGETTCDAEEEGWYCEFNNKLRGTTSKTGTKTWKDGNKPELRPDTLELIIYQQADTDVDEVVYNATPTWTKNNNNTWTYSYDNLPLYDDNGIRFSYRVEEKFTQNTAKNGDKYVSQQSAQAGDFVNLLTGKVNFCGKKVWVDSDAPDDFRPEQIMVTLSRDDGTKYFRNVTATTPSYYAEVCNETVEETGEVWYFAFTDLDKYDDNGRQYAYELDEVTSDLEQYISSVVDDTVTNTYAPHKTSFTVEKIWENDKKEDRPGYIDVTLYRNGVAYSTVRLSEDSMGKWRYTWENLDDNYTWTVTEDIQIPNYYPGWYEYTSQVDGTYVRIFNQKIEDTPETGDKGVSLYVISAFAVAAGGLFIAHRFASRR